jgi:arylsulfatase A-like enzyme
MQTKLGQLLLLAGWFGLVVGLSEVCIRSVQVFLLHQRIWLSPHVVWMAPLADVLVFVVATLLLLLAGKFWPKLLSPWTVLFVLTFLGLLGPLLSIERLHWLASVLLALGLAMQTARVVAARVDALQLRVRRTTVPLVVIVATLALLVTGWRAFETRRALWNLPSAPVVAPNVLLIVLDTVRAQNLSLYGYERRTTPELERLATTGVVFEKALSTSPWTLPAHASMFTGRFPYEVSADWLTPLDSRYPTLAEMFGAHGYVTAGFVANLIYATYETGLARGFIHYEDYPVSLEMVGQSSWLARLISEKLQKITRNHHGFVRKTAQEVNKDFLRWLSRQDERPFFAFLNYMDAHAPYVPPKPFDVMFGPKRPDVPLKRGWSLQEIFELRNGYDGSIAYLDHQLGSLFDELRRRGLLERTLVVVTSDHGEHLGEHDLVAHGNSLYRPVLHVPLLISFPTKIAAGERVWEPVTLRDLAATIVDVVGLKEVRLPGHSLARYWSGAQPLGDVEKSPLLSEVSASINMPEWEPASRGHMKSLVVDGSQYIKNGDGVEELYDFEHDAAEQRNLVNSEEGQRLIARFRKFLESILSEVGGERG